jgi:hypothetical protein
MRMRMNTAPVLSALLVLVIALTGVSPASASAGESMQPRSSTTRVTLRDLVNPSSRIEVQGRLIRFALLGQIRFDTLDDLFAYIDTQAGRWTFDSAATRQAFADGLMRRGVESRVVSMETELPLELVLTHTRAELERAVTNEKRRDAPLVFKGQHWQLTTEAYRDAFLRVRDRWSRSLNCWSASSSIPGRVLSNWFILDEGIELFGATYDSTEHFWQAVKYHPDVTVGELQTLISALLAIDWRPWVDAMAADQDFYFANSYAVEFLKWNLARERLESFRAELGRVAMPTERAREAQQRINRAAGAPIRFMAVDEKVLWGDLADVLHLIVAFGNRPAARAVPALAAMRESIVARHFDAVYLAGYAGGRMGFLSTEFQALMLEIWKVKFLKIPRLNEVIRSTAGVRLDHFLNDGDSPDIPIPIYVGYLNRIREMALEIHP